MIVKAHRDGSFYVADNGNWRLAGPFETTEQAWEWIDEHSGPNDANDPPNPAQPRIRHRELRTNTSISPDQVTALAPVLLGMPKLKENERAFVLQMQRKASMRKSLKLTERQARWWQLILKRHVPKQATKLTQMEMGV